MNTIWNAVGVTGKFAPLIHGRGESSVSIKEGQYEIQDKRGKL